jgi:tryptophan synthase beta subunit
MSKMLLKSGSNSKLMMKCSIFAGNISDVNVLGIELGHGWTTSSSCPAVDRAESAIMAGTAMKMLLDLAMSVLNMWSMPRGMKKWLVWVVVDPMHAGWTAVARLHGEVAIGGPTRGVVRARAVPPALQEWFRFPENRLLQC